MKTTEQELRSIIRKVLMEDAGKFEDGMQYVADITGGLTSDAKDFILAKGKDKDQAKQFFKDVGAEALRDLRDTAQAFDELAKEELDGYGEDPDGDQPVKNEEIPVDTTKPIETQVDQFEDQLEEFEADMDNFEAELESAVEKNPPPDDDMEAFNNIRTKFQKYHDFLIKRLYKKIAEYAMSKDRKDIVMLASKNVTTLNKWKKEFQDGMKDAWGEVFKTDGDDASKSQKVTFSGSFKPVITIYKTGIKDLTKVIKAVKSDPLKKLDPQNLTEGLRKQRAILFENYCKRVSNQVNVLGD